MQTPFGMRALTEARVAEVAVLDGIDAAWVGWSAAGQTVALLSQELAQLQARVTSLKRAPGVLEFDMADLLCGVLGSLQKPALTVSRRQNR